MTSLLIRSHVLLQKIAAFGPSQAAKPVLTEGTAVGRGHKDRVKEKRDKLNQEIDQAKARGKQQVLEQQRDSRLRDNTNTANANQAGFSNRFEQQSKPIKV